MAILLRQAYQLARARLASAASPIIRLLAQRDQAVSEVDLLGREVEVFRAHLFTEVRINPALARGDGFGQRSASAGPPFGRRENGLDNRLG